MSTFAISTHLPRDIARHATFSTVVYANEQWTGSIASFTLLPSGYDRSVVSLHFPAWVLGITPILFLCTGTCGKGPSILPSLFSLSMYLVMDMDGGHVARRWSDLFAPVCHYPEPLFQSRYDIAGEMLVRVSL